MNVEQALEAKIEVFEAAVEVFKDGNETDALAAMQIIASYPLSEISKLYALRRDE